MAADKESPSVFDCQRASTVAHHGVRVRSCSESSQPARKASLHLVIDNEGARLHTRPHSVCVRSSSHPMALSATQPGLRTRSPARHTIGHLVPSSSMQPLHARLASTSASFEPRVTVWCADASAKYVRALTRRTGGTVTALSARARLARASSPSLFWTVAHASAASASSTRRTARSILSTSRRPIRPACRPIGRHFSAGQLPTSPSCL